ncbi:IS1 family transposase [Geminocystis sp. NIES-3708]|uniref:IS1 family transposase n=1 Tax=Geminocystis sp. NIES-3708 TaxID=1615909 RepID=UPI001E2C614E|nr:IS1 family transposase [Geminocystis sp. NIES-3708]
MKCPECGSKNINKNGIKKGKQNHICVHCRGQFIAPEQLSGKGYSDDLRKECLKMYVNGMGFRAIGRIKQVHHTTIISWVKAVGQILPQSYHPETRPEVGELDELQTFVGSKKTIWRWTAVDHFHEGILEWVIGDRSAKTFRPLWEQVKKWHCYFYVTDGWKVYGNFIPEGDQIICKTYMTRVEGENTRLRHYLARLHRKTLCYSKSMEILKYSVSLLIHYLKFKDIPIPFRPLGRPTFSLLHT